MIGPAHTCTSTCATPKPYEFPPPFLVLGFRDPLELREKSDSHCPQSLSNSHKQRNPDNRLVQMSTRQQQITGNLNSFNNNSFNNIGNFITGIDDEGHQILLWLSPLEPQQRHQGVRADRLGGVGIWVLETSEFMKWRDAEDGCVEQVLFCHGNPGVGKTYVR